MLPPSHLLLITALTIFLATPCFSQSAVLWRPQEPQRGSTWQEDVSMEVAGMKISVGSGNQAIDGGGYFSFHEIVERKHTGVGRQEARMQESTLQGTLAFLGQTADQMQGGVLLGKKMLGKKEQDAWKFEFKDVKPSQEEQKALDAFAGRTGLLALWPYLYGTQARKKGETWKADTTFLTKGNGKTASPLTIDLNFTFVDVEEKAGSRCARLGVTGFFKIAPSEKNPATITLDVQGDIWREPRDMVDVEMNLQGTLKVSGAKANDPKLPPGTALELSAPFTLKRTVKPVK
ncbi:hypothetical protein [Roseimicrobium gellanilyticum]|nr:hypothetical protein [Roseimicrobium gellanilyticum]